MVEVVDWRGYYLVDCVDLVDRRGLCRRVEEDFWKRPVTLDSVDWITSC